VPRVLDLLSNFRGPFGVRAAEIGGNWPSFDSGHPCFMVPELIIRDTSPAARRFAAPGQNSGEPHESAAVHAQLAQAFQEGGIGEPEALGGGHPASFEVFEDTQHVSALHMFDRGRRRARG
jgi:hypothetical protein